MLKAIKNKSIYFYYFSIASTLLLFITTYLQQRSIFIDEAHLALNIIERSFEGLTTKLDNEQYAPIPFLWFSKLITAFFGVSELSLRLLPLLFSIGNIFVLDRLSSKLNANYIFRAIVIFLFGWQFNNILFATEFKQYSLDLFISLGFLNYIKSKYYKPLITLLFGSFSIWFSMPFCFFLAAYFGNKLYCLLRTKSTIQPIILISPIAWGVSFILFYITVLQQGVSSDFMQSFHHQFFWPLFPKNINDFNQIHFIITSILNDYFSASVHHLLVLIPTLLFGLYQLLKRNELVIITLFSAFVITVITSAFGFYSLIPRTLYCFIPLFYLPIAEAILKLTTINRMKALSYISVLIIISPVIKNIKHLYSDLDRGQARQALHETNKHGISTHYLLFPGTHSTYQLYSQHHSNKENYLVHGEIIGVNKLNLYYTIDSLKGIDSSNTISILWGHTMNYEIESTIYQLKGKYSIEKESTFLRSATLKIN